MTDFQQRNSTNLTLISFPSLTSVNTVQDWFRLVFYGVIFFLGTVGNTLVILAYRNPRMRSVTNLFIANLGVADLTVTLINIPVSTTYSLVHEWPFGLVLCKGIAYLFGVTIFSSVGTLVAIATDRYRAIVHPLLPRIRTRHAIMMIVSIWIVACIYPIPVIIYTKLDKSQCIEQWPSETAPKLYTIMVFVALYLIPLIAISVLYFLISHNLSTSESTTQAGARRAKRSVIRMLVIVVVMFAVCWLPFHIVFLYLNLVDVLNPTLIYFSQWLMYANSACNPVVYAVLNRNYRREFIRILRCQSLAVSKYIHCDSFNERYKDSSMATRTSMRRTSKTRTRVTLHKKSNANEEMSFSENVVQNGHKMSESYQGNSIQGNSSSGLGQSVYGEDKPSHLCYESGC